MKIRNIDLGEQPVVLAPMEDVTDPAFRLMCKRFGADMVYTEFVSADALIRSVNKTMAKLNIDEQERPVAIQIYGRDVATIMSFLQTVPLRWGVPKRLWGHIARTITGIP